MKAPRGHSIEGVGSTGRVAAWEGRPAGVWAALWYGAQGLTIHEINPLTDNRWGELVEQHSSGSLFHTRGWLEALRRTYGFETAALTTSAPGEVLRNGLVYCRVRSWLTGHRLVSLPFSDHCEPLVRSEEELAELLDGFRGRVQAGGYGYGDIRPWTARVDEKYGFGLGQRYVAHRLDLRLGAKAVFRGFHKDCIQRKIRRAEREKVVVERGNSAGLLQEFYGLMIQTRRRHGLPPQPIEWFRNLSECLGEALTVWLARKDGQPAATIVTGRQGRVVVYKYGASDARMHALGCMPYLMWRVVEDCVERGMEWLDLGRTDEGQSGLIAFKDHLGAERSVISYWRWPEESGGAPSGGLGRRMMGEACRRLPESWLTGLGSVLYRHLG